MIRLALGAKFDDTPPFTFFRKFGNLNKSHMTYIRIDTKTKQAKKFVELIETMPFAEILEEPNSTTKKAMEMAKKGKVKKYSGANDLLDYLNK